MDKEFKKYRKQEAYKVPNGYFEDFAYQMQLKIGEEKQSTSWLSRLTFALQLRWSIPTFLVFALVYFSLWLNSSQSNYMLDQDIQAYLANEDNRWANSDELFDLAYEEHSSFSENFNDIELRIYLEEESSYLELFDEFD